MKFWWGQYKKTEVLFFFKVECLWKLWINIFNSIMEKYFCWYYNWYNLSISSWKNFSSTQFKFVWYLIKKWPEVVCKVIELLIFSISEYNKLHNLRFLECVIKESLRLWGLNFFDRTCSKEYHLTDVNFTVPKGKAVDKGSSPLSICQRKVIVWVNVRHYID